MDFKAGLRSHTVERAVWTFGKTKTCEAPVDRRGNVTETVTHSAVQSPSVLTFKIKYLKCSCSFLRFQRSN